MFLTSRTTTTTMDNSYHCIPAYASKSQFGVYCVHVDVTKYVHVCVSQFGRDVYEAVILVAAGADVAENVYKTHMKKVNMNIAITFSYACATICYL